MYQITNHDPAPPSSANQQVPVMLDYIIAKCSPRPGSALPERGRFC